VSATDAFASIVRSPELGDRLDDAALALASARAGEVDLDAARSRLDRLAQRCDDPTFGGVVASMRSAGFTGNRTAYYDPANSYLDRVLERQTGIPITLSIVAISVGRRVGVPIVGIGMPSHFLIGSPDGERFADPFNGIDQLDPVACGRLFEDVIAPGVSFDPAYLQPADPVDIVRRMLHNLIAIFRQTQARGDLLWSTELATRLPDAAEADERAHIDALAASGRFDTAARRLERIGSSDPGDQARADALRARLN
jgi:regulator of sirC expression with transglutaminase-like and TPR domain